MGAIGLLAAWSGRVGLGSDWVLAGWPRPTRKRGTGIEDKRCWLRGDVECNWWSAVKGAQGGQHICGRNAQGAELRKGGLDECIGEKHGGRRGG